MTKADEDAIREIELRFNRAWGRHDADAMVESLVDDAQFVTVNGAWTKTRDGFRDLMRRLHGANGPFRSSIRASTSTATLTRASAPVSVLGWCERLMDGGGPSQCRIPTYAPAGGTRRQPAAGVYWHKTAASDRIGTVAVTPTYQTLGTKEEKRA